MSRREALGWIVCAGLSMWAVGYVIGIVVGLALP